MGAAQPRRLLLGALLLAIVAAAFAPFHGRARAAGSGSAPPSGALHRVYTLLDYFQSGRLAVDEYVRASDASGATLGLAETIRRCKRYCVQLDMRFSLGGSRYESAVASGVLIDGGSRVLTAGHAVVGVGEIEIRVTYPGGLVRSARVISSEYERFGTPEQDWALLEVQDPPRANSDAVALGRAREGEMVLVLGFPDQIGVDALGKVAYASGGRGGYHEPLVMLAMVQHTNPLNLAPWAGSIPTRGMSGGPVFDLSGRLAGVFVSVSSSQTDGETTQWFDACSAEVVRRHRDPRPGAVRQARR